MCHILLEESMDLYYTLTAFRFVRDSFSYTLLAGPHENFWSVRHIQLGLADLLLYMDLTS